MLGSVRLLEEGGGEKLPKEGGDKKLPEETPTGTLIMYCTDKVVPVTCSFGFIMYFPLDSQNPGNTVGRIEDVPEKAVSEVRATTSLVSLGSFLDQEKMKLAYKLLGVSSRIYRVLVSLDRVVYIDPLVFTFLAGGVGAGE